MPDRAPNPAGFTAPPERLVTDGRQVFGRFTGPPRAANLLDAHYRGLPRPLRRLRLKEWQALQIATPDLFVNVALFDAKLMALRQLKIYEHARQQKTLVERKLLPGALHLADQLLDSTNTHRDRHGHLTFTNRVSDGRIEVSFAHDRPRVEARLVVHTARGAAQVVSLPIDAEVGMYSHKGLFPVEGELTVDGRRYALTADRALALLDDHKGYYPYVMRWDWVTSAVHDAHGRAVGLNLTRNQCRDPAQYNENCAWIGDRVGRLPAVECARERVREPGERWRLTDREGRVDITFEPTVPGDVRVNALVVESRYRGPFGHLRGRVAPEGLEPIEVEGWFGMGEEFWLRC